MINMRSKRMIARYYQMRGFCNRSSHTIQVISIVQILETGLRPFVFCALFLGGTLHATAQPETPANFTAQGYDSHVELEWEFDDESGLKGFKIYRSENGEDFELVRTAERNDRLILDFIGEFDQPLDYKITAYNTAGLEGAPSEVVNAKTFEMTDEELLTMVQEYTFRYFWNFAHPSSGLMRERNTSGKIVTMGGSGFGVMAILVGIERGFITWEEGLERLVEIVAFLEGADRFYGVFPHWMNGETGEVIPFSAKDDGGDIVETAFLAEGLLTVREYFDGDSPNEVVLRQKITNIWEEINWDWYRNNGDVMLWHWSPVHGFALNHQIRGWNETMIVYLLGIASPSQSIPASLYNSGWTGGNYENGNTIYGYTLDVGSLTGGPLFFAHYSFMGFDPRYVRDEYANYFTQNKNHTLINRAYCIDNPGNYEGYSDVCWGLTASDDPLVGYLAHEANLNRDNGTITPTAAISSMPYTPNESLAALKYFYRELGDKLWGPMGFYDAFNLSEDWYATSYLAIDQGPIICMIENYRTQLLWNNFMKNPEINEALDKIGFVPDSSLTSVKQNIPTKFRASVSPMPATDFLHIQLQENPGGSATITLMDIGGTILLQEKDVQFNKNGSHMIHINGIIPGFYILSISIDETVITKSIVIANT